MKDSEPAGRAPSSATRPEPGLHTPPAPSAPDGRDHLFLVPLHIVMNLLLKCDGGELTCTTGMTNARVLPLPVGADTQISLGL